MASLLSILKPSLLSFLSLISSSFHIPATKNTDPVPATWPLQFHSLIYVNNNINGTLEVVDLWYDWPNRRNFNIIQKQLGELLYNLEWGNGTSYVYTLDANRKCFSVLFSVGILRPNWLDGAEYLGRRIRDTFECNVWKKVDFIWYYEDVVSKRPVAWEFFDGVTAHVMSFEVGKVLEDHNWQAPSYCFDEEQDERRSYKKGSSLFYDTANLNPLANGLKSFLSAFKML